MGMIHSFLYCMAKNHFLTIVYNLNVKKYFIIKSIGELAKNVIQCEVKVESVIEDWLLLLCRPKTNFRTLLAEITANEKEMLEYAMTYQ